MKGQKLHKKRVTLAFAINSTGIDKLKLLVIYTFEQPPWFGRWQPHEHVQWHSNKIAWMKEEIFEAWILQFNNQFKGQN